MSRMSDLFTQRQERAETYPSHPGFKQQSTSKQAAARMHPRARTLREQVYEAIRLLPGTPDEIAARLQITVLACRPRVSELLTLGKIEQTGERRRNESGMNAHVYRANE